MMHFALYFLFNPATFPLVITLIILINRQSVFSTLRLPHTLVQMFAYWNFINYTRFECHAIPKTICNTCACGGKQQKMMLFEKKNLMPLLLKLLTLSSVNNNSINVYA